MTTVPVLVVHGVSNRCERAFTEMVGDLGRRVNAKAASGVHYNLVPAYWGDLAGGDGANLHDALPPTILAETFGVRGDADVDALVEHIYRTRRELQTHMVRSEFDAARVIAESAQARAAQDTAGPFATRGTAGVDDAELAQAIADAVRASTYLRRVRDPDLLHSVGEVVGASLSSSPDGAVETRGIVSGIRDTVARVIGAIDDLLGSITAEGFGALNQAIRGALAKATALSFGDIVAYRDSTNGAKIRSRIVECARRGTIDTSEPITIVAHSLGGLVVLDMLLDGGLKARRLVTCGSQPAMFHVLKRLAPLMPYAPGQSTRLPAAIEAWTNLWHPMDVLAFVVSPVFVLDNGVAPTDLKIDTPLSAIVDDRFWMHSAYWDSDALVEAIM